MLNSISWSDYFSSLCILLVVYYLTILYSYYRWELLEKIGVKRIEGDSFRGGSITDFTGHPPSDVMPYQAKEAQGFEASLSQNCFDEMQAFLHEASNAQMNASDALNGLQQISAKHNLQLQFDHHTQMSQEVQKMVKSYYPALSSESLIKILFK